MVFAIPFPEIGPELFAFSIAGFEFAIRWYALAYIAGILIGWQIVKSLSSRPALWRNETSPMSREAVEDLLTFIVLGVILGGRIGFVLFYQPAYYLANPVEILFIWQGGMAFHGGLLGVALALVLFARKHGAPLMSAADALAVATPPGLFLGRSANFINGELWGRPTDLPWGVIFPGLRAQDCPGIEGLCARHPSQLYEAVLEGLILGALLLWLAYRKGALKWPGQLTGVFLAGYGTARFIVEFFRQADAQFITPGNPFGHVVRLGEAGVTMGQLLSLPMLALGLVLIALARWGTWTR
ncbi:prolipoprotein diacylglyceryl transferase [Ovoidimarina sediminis]|uniref:prolipoprotein diacylglyceryl transferase n=1 Tax=Ovoidimarina sediminis TaxID=3079856 RepID=UPI0029073642|nr:prolipoprotein diacylglyceryl transferase [Rhodophyticola sp. MJ-SS7]MDU8942995.1 prolipoprotein diacylglyceryl transferase [Rhodophyticola sp. MJ-SS7]